MRQKVNCPFVFDNGNGGKREKDECPCPHENSFGQIDRKAEQRNKDEKKTGITIMIKARFYFF